MKPGRVIRIFDNYRAAINLGLADGMEVGTRVGVYTPTDTVIDPETGEALGTYRRRKALLVTQEVFERFSVAMPPRRRERVVDSAPTSVLHALSGSRSRYRTVRDELPVDSSVVQPLPTGADIEIGDIVLLLDEDDMPIEGATDKDVEPQEGERSSNG